MKPRFSTTNQSGRMWPLLGIVVGCALGIVLRNWALGLAVVMLGCVGFLHANFQLEGRREKNSLGAMYALVLFAAVLAARGRPELVWTILFLAVLIDIFREGRQ